MPFTLTPFTVAGIVIFPSAEIPLTPLISLSEFKVKTVVAASHLAYITVFEVG